MLDNRSAYREKWKLVPSGSRRTEAGFFSLYMCEVDWSPGRALGCTAWEAYTNANGFEMIFSKAPVEDVSSAIASLRPSWHCIQDIGSRSYRGKGADGSDLGIEILVLRLDAWPWTLIARGAQSDRHTGLWTLANQIHGITKADTKSLTGTDALELSVNHDPIHQEWIDFDDVPHHEWLTERGIFVPPYQCADDEEGYFHVWLAGVLVSQVERLDLLTSSRGKDVALEQLRG